MATVPRKNSVGFKHEAHPPKEGTSFWIVDGPGIDEMALTQSEETAKTIAAALNFAHNFAAVQRQAKFMSDQLAAFGEEFK